MRKITSIIIADGKEKEVKRYRKFVEKGDTSFDFESVIPQPYRLRKLQVYQEILSLEDEIELLTSFGACDLFSWRKMHWGTRLPTQSVSWFSNRYIKMITSEEPARGIFAALSLMFNIIFYMVYANSYRSGLIKFNKGHMLEISMNGNEAEAVHLLAEDPNFTFKRWLLLHPDASTDRKIEMETLINHPVCYMKTAIHIIRNKVNEIDLSTAKPVHNEKM